MQILPRLRCRCALVLLVVFVSWIGAAGAAPIFELQNVQNTAEASAASGDNDGVTSDGPYIITNNPANASGTATRGGHTGHADGYAAYDESPTVVHLVGTGNAYGSVGADFGAGGTANVHINAEQDFGFDTVQVHIVGTLYRNDSAPFGSGGINFSFGSYSQMLLPGNNGTVAFDDVVTVSGNQSLYASLIDSQPNSGTFGSYSGTASYDITLSTIVPEPSSALWLAALALLKRRR